MKIDFWKMHGAANDFIMVDDRGGAFPSSDSAWLKSIGARHTGVGCEGIILIQDSEKASFRMRFFNPDGNEVEMCGNGARCVARLAHDIGAAPAEMTIDTVAGILKATVSGSSVVLGMTGPRDWCIDQELDISGTAYNYSSVNTGVPHAVIFVDDLKGLDIMPIGSAVRYHAKFAPAGTNANFVCVEDDGSLSIRTYERGVEGETQACGTGMTAAALIAAKKQLVQSPVTVIPASGDKIVVGFNLTDEGAANVTLEGPAEYVFKGILEYSR